MKIGNRGGHTRTSYGAVDNLDEYVEDRLVIKRVNELLSQYHTIIDCTPSDDCGNGEWNIGVRIANENGVDLFFSIHFNSALGGKGCECCIASGDNNILPYANSVLSNLNKLGFVNRGIKYRDDLAECVGCKMPSMIIEVCFVQEPDATLYRTLGIEKVARAIANGIDSRIELDNLEVYNNPSTLQGEKGIVLTSGYVNVREGADINSKIITQIKSGQIVDVYKKYPSGWCTIFLNNKNGYLDGNVVYLGSKVTGLEVRGTKKVGDLITVVASADNSNDTWFKFWLKEEGQEWQVVKDYSAVRYIEFTPKESKKYYVQVDVINKQFGQVAKADNSYSELIEIVSNDDNIDELTKENENLKLQLENAKSTIKELEDKLENIKNIIQ